MEYTFTLTQQETLVLSEALGNMPYRTVTSLIQKLNEQISKQQNPMETKVEDTNP